MTNEQEAKALTHLFATIGSRTERGGWVAEVAGKMKYRGLTLARVGDIVHYDDGSEAVVVDGAGFAATSEDKPIALVGSRLSNGDVITQTLQDGVGIRVADDEPIPGLFDPAYVPPPARPRYRLAVKGATTARGGVLREATGTWDVGELLGKSAVVGNVVHYADGSTARIISGLGIANCADFVPLAFVGSELSNGDTVTDSPEREGRGFADTFTVVKLARLADQEAAT
ncbi:PAAR domain-containing protein [Burkholderia sp. S-53]|uniref:PAAR domain-containing protein n=1 Tax=Burkholderia sp. S-53 TaxID=2906514 RepID=UPI0021CF751D|nr:PAAR domain-containing protein [Burkholderia sp. S-53]UXU90274.1 PAAR domain-containing protein [Burkholderia sp. S-53]